MVRSEALIRARAVDAAYDFALADQLWGIYQMIGKLRPAMYAVRRA